MQSMNRIFIQLHEADRLAQAKNPHLRRFAVVLLDNVIELQLYNKALWAFAPDQTTWYSGVRQFNDKTRREVLRNHAELLKFAKSSGWITEDGFITLTFAHRIRNAFYHKGQYERTDAELVIRLLYRFIREHFPVWRTSMPLIGLSPYEPIPLEAAPGDATGFCPLMLVSGEHWDDSLRQSDVVGDPDYWSKAMDRVLSYAPPDDLRLLIFKKIEEELDQIETDLESLTAYPVDFNWVLSRRFCVFTPAFTDALGGRRELRDPVAALNIYLAMLDAEEKLLDVEDENERRIAFHKVLGQHTFVPDPIPRDRIQAVRDEANGIAESTEDEGIKMFVRIELEFSKTGHALRELARDLDGFLEEEADLRRGK
jgi:hypothetical protein